MFHRQLSGSPVGIQNVQKEERKEIFTHQTPHPVVLSVSADTITMQISESLSSADQHYAIAGDGDSPILKNRHGCMHVDMSVGSWRYRSTTSLVHPVL